MNARKPIRLWLPVVLGIIAVAGIGVAPGLVTTGVEAKLHVAMRDAWDDREAAHHRPAAAGKQQDPL